MGLADTVTEKEPEVDAVNDSDTEGLRDNEGDGEKVSDRDAEPLPLPPPSPRPVEELALAVAHGVWAPVTVPDPAPLRLGEELTLAQPVPEDEPALLEALRCVVSEALGQPLAELEPQGVLVLEPAGEPEADGEAETLAVSQGLADADTELEGEGDEVPAPALGDAVASGEPELLPVSHALFVAGVDAIADADTNVLKEASIVPLTLTETDCVEEREAEGETVSVPRGLLLTRGEPELVGDVERERVPLPERDGDALTDRDRVSVAEAERDTTEGEPYALPLRDAEVHADADGLPEELAAPEAVPVAEPLPVLVTVADAECVAEAVPEEEPVAEALDVSVSSCSRRAAAAPSLSAAPLLLRETPRHEGAPVSPTGPQTKGRGEGVEAEPKNTASGAAASSGAPNHSRMQQAKAPRATMPNPPRAHRERRGAGISAPPPMSEGGSSGEIIVLLIYIGHRPVFHGFMNEASNLSSPHRLET